MKILSVTLLSLLPLLAFATGQQMDVLKYDGADFKISIFPLETSPIRKSQPLTFPLPEGYKAPIRFTQNTNSTRAITFSTGNYRGYVATWEIRNNKLYLSGIQGWVAHSHVKLVPHPSPEHPNRHRTDTTITYTRATVDALFPDDVQDGRVLADWYSGELFTGGWHPGIKRSREVLDQQKRKAKLIFRIKNGNVVTITDRRNPDQRTVNTTKATGDPGHEGGTGSSGGITPIQPYGNCPECGANVIGTYRYWHGTDSAGNPVTKAWCVSTCPCGKSLYSFDTTSPRVEWKVNDNQADTTQLTDATEPTASSNNQVEITCMAVSFREGESEELGFEWTPVSSSNELHRLSREELSSLIYKLPSAARLAQDQALLKSAAQSEKQTSATKRAKGNIEKAQQTIPRIRRSMVEGSSIFDYPGLLAKAIITHDPSSDKYHLRLGYRGRRYEGPEGYSFNITLSGTGVILSIEDDVAQH